MKWSVLLAILGALVIVGTMIMLINLPQNQVQDMSKVPVVRITPTP